MAQNYDFAYKILLLGDLGVGKTSITARLEGTRPRKEGYIIFEKILNIN